jgi:hypothetical protein
MTVTAVDERLLTPERLAELRAAAEKATSGDWMASGVTHKFDGVSFLFVNIDGLGEVCRIPQPDHPAKGYAPSICDQRHIANFSPSTAIALIDALEAARKEIAGLREGLAKAAMQMEVMAAAPAIQTSPEAGR